MYKSSFLTSTALLIPDLILSSRYQYLKYVIEKYDFSLFMRLFEVPFKYLFTLDKQYGLLEINPLILDFKLKKVETVFNKEYEYKLFFSLIKITKSTNIVIFYK